MRKILIPVLLALLTVGGAQAFAQTATVVTQSGQRLRGQLIDMGQYGDVIVRLNGRDRRIPVGDIAVIDFVGNGNIPQSEMNRANQSYDGLVVLRNGQTIAGRVLDFQPSNHRAIVTGQFGQRNIALSQVARIHFASTTARNYDRYGDNRSYDPYYDENPSGGAYGNYGQYGQYGNYGQGPSAANRTITVPVNQAWTSSGIDVRRGEVIHFRASGNVALSHNSGDYGTPAGARDGRLAGNSPLPDMTGGMLIGRVGNSQPFAIGSNADITMPANGRLYFGVNDDYVGDNSGNYVVQLWQR